ncbi:Hypothetical protein EUBREC_0519 [Agathobacter rectalis ATCC 33656]|uniref:Uncharacterized protein n=1 Tax=Agathobacter rectalis (strain ATCC 33656 / DSM 3377 / JCM 17463 / KCTC 5835 / VPI 0990) TaxID=515619 RepID=C4ZC20_AGARV|nr:Hypothetical protein EUBREC_0519 [Agathobacter rectalis ATCC 33656]
MKMHFQIVCTTLQSCSCASCNCIKTGNNNCNLPINPLYCS